MTDLGPLETIFDRLARADSRREVFGASDIERWPSGTLPILINAGLLERTTPAQIIECEGCERNCFKQVTVRPAAGGRPAWIFIACNEPEDMGRIHVQPMKLEQLQITDAMLASAVARLLGFAKPLHEEPSGRRWTLGPLEREGTSIRVSLSIEGTVKLELCGQSVPLARLLVSQGNELGLDQGMLTRIFDDSATSLGSVSWRKKKAQDAANIRHNKPGGSRDKQQRIRQIWASGKYSSRDLCADEEAAALGMAPSTARKALRNTPKPKRRT
jgi:hypothetical protein